jgi:hypothetical protein
MDLRNLATNEPFLPRSSYTIAEALRILSQALGRAYMTERGMRDACSERRVTATKVGKTWHVSAHWVRAECKRLSALAEVDLENSHVTS